MANPELSWELCRSFLSVLREGSLSRAARALRLTQPTVGRHIDEIERCFRATLFVRSPQGLSPTDAASELRPYAEAMAAAAEAMVRAASGAGRATHGTVRITAPELVGAEVLPGILADFRQLYPGVVIELALTHRTEDLLKREADIAVRMVPSTQAALVARQVGHVHFALYAHRTYLDRHGMPTTRAELGEHALIGFDRGFQFITPLRNSRTPLTREMLAFRSDSALAQLAALRAGFGIGACPRQVARHDPNLLPVLPELVDVKVPMWVVMHKDARNTRRIRLMFDHLVTALAAHGAPRPGTARDPVSPTGAAR